MHKFEEFVKLPLKNSGINWVFDSNDVFVFKFTNKALSLDEKASMIELINGINDSKINAEFSYVKNDLFINSSPLLEVNFDYRLPYYRFDLEQGMVDEIRNEFMEFLISRLKL